MLLFQNVTARLEHLFYVVRVDGAREIRNAKLVVEILRCLLIKIVVLHVEFIFVVVG